jgi:SAM-dependent methyltransferase
MIALARVMDHTLAYRVFQAPFAEAKFAPVLRHSDLRAARRVLDVGCGPGTNTHHFTHVEYLGLDINPRYVAYARRRWGRERGGPRASLRFEVADVTSYRAPAGERFDFILLNSFLHHIATPDVRRILAHVAELLSPGGVVHVLDLVRPERPGIARTLAQWDRGHYARPLAEWRALFAESLEPVVFEPYRLGILGATLWSMVYFQGRSRG